MNMLCAKLAGWRKLPRAVVWGMLITHILGCGTKDSPAAAAEENKPSEMVKLSQFGHAGSCEAAVGADGTIHAIFSDFKEYGKPAYLYYRSSSDNGATWTDAKVISDDESVLSAGFCRVLIDGSGRVYAIWKYISPNELLEGPNGPANGVLAYRVLEGGTWSKPRLFGDEHKPMTSWFAALDKNGKVNIVYSRADDAIDWKGRGMMSYHANNTDQLILDGAADPKVVPLLVAKHVLTQAEQDAMKAAGKYPAYEETVPRNDGVWNLNGYIADDGTPRFLAEAYPASGHQPTILRYDGKALQPYYEYKASAGNTFNHPPALVRTSDGKEHVIRKPEVGESESVRDYLVENGEPGEKTDVITNDSPTAKISGWWVSQLANGQIATMAAVAPNVDPLGPTDLYVSVFDGKSWSKPANVTDNANRATFFAKAGVSQSTSYRPTLAAALVLKDGSVGVIMLNAECTISGLDVAGVTSSGRAVIGTSSFSTESPYVSFTRIKG